MNKALLAVVGLLVVGGAAFFIIQNNSMDSSEPTTPSTTSPVDNSPSGGTEVTIDNMTFAPTNITVKVGDTVTWTNNDQMVHTVTSDDGVFDSGQMNTGETFSHTFTEAGTFPYNCTLHPNMRAQVTVVE